MPLNAAEFYNDWATNHLSSVPSQSGPTDDPDSDGVANLAEYAFGTDPLVSDSIGGAILPLPLESNGVFKVEIFERAGHRPGVQIDLDATASLTNWFRPWWLRTPTNSLPDDPPNSVRELFTTWMPETNIFFVRGSIHLFDPGPEVANYYVATNGNDTTGNGSINNPYATLAKAVGLANPGELVYVRGGKYAVGSKISLSKKTGTATQTIRIRAYPGETPTFDCSSTPGGTDCLSISGYYYQLYGLVITNAGHNSVNISGNNNTVERCISLGARNTGIHITGGQTGSTFPSSNLVLNCDSIRNYDPPVGGNADGFTAKWNLGPGNVFRGCRAWENSDDGWDLWMGTATVLIENCWSFRNASNVWNSASFDGNGNGFKLGGNYVATPHRIVNCLSFDNRMRGYDQNNNLATLTVDNCTAWNNPTNNFQLNHPPTNAMPHIVRNNLSVAGGPDVFYTGSTLISNSWQLITSPPPGTNDFLSMDTSWAVAPRRDDGGLPDVPFMRPVPGGRLVDQGADIGEPFSGTAPDLGAFETFVW